MRVENGKPCLNAGLNKATCPFSSFQPINIPAFALSTKVDVDMNQELVAHGFSNILAGVCGGLQNYMAYTQSVLYVRPKEMACGIM